MKKKLGKLMAMLDHSSDGEDNTEVTPPPTGPNKKVRHKGSKQQPKATKPPVKEYKHTPAKKSTRPAPPRISSLYDVKESKRDGSKRYENANLCLLDWMRGHRAGDHKKLPPERPQHITLRYSEGTKGLQDGKTVEEIAAAQKIDMSRLPEMAEVDRLISFAEFNCLAQNNCVRLRDKSDPLPSSASRAWTA